MDAPPGQRVEVAGEDGNKSFAFAGFHLGDPSLMQNDAADELHRVGAHSQNTVRGLPHGGKGLRQNVVHGFAVCQTLPELRGLGLQRVLRESFIFLLQSEDPVYDGLYFLHFTLGGRAEQFGKKTHMKTPLYKRHNFVFYPL